MRLMHNINPGPKINITLLTDKIPETHSVDYYVEVESQVKASLTEIAAQIKLLTKLHACQSICTVDVEDLKKLYPSRAEWLSSLVVTVVPTRTSYSMIITELYDVTMKNMVDLANEVQQRYIEVIPVSTDAQPNGSMATYAVLQLVTSMQQIFQRSATIQELSSPCSLAFVACTIGSTVDLSTLTQPAILRELTSVEVRENIIQDFTIVRTLLLMVKNNTFNSMNGLNERYVLLNKACQGLPLAKIIPAWKAVH